jgi:two-component system sensor histidine kinase and response regulator WspE
MSDLSGFSLWELFRSEVETQTQALTAALLVLETDPRHADQLAAAMRAAHSLKGAARIVQLMPAQQLTHAIEDCFVAAQEGRITIDAAAIDVFLHSVDLLTSIGGVAESDAGQWSTAREPDVARLIASLAAIKDGRPALAPSAASASARPEIHASDGGTPPKPPEMQRGEGGPAAPGGAPLAPGAPRAAAPVRVGAQTLSRIIGMAGDVLVAANWLQPVTTALNDLKRRQSEVVSLLDELREGVAPGAAPAELDARLLEIRRRVDEVRAALAVKLPELEAHTLRASTVADRLYHDVVATRMRPFSDGVEGFPRLVRDVARSVGKKAQLEIRGGETLVDREMLETLEAPLNHMVRNAVDHGLEFPEERVAAGKSAAGTVRLEARHRAGLLVISVSDDGRGVDYDRLRSRIAEKGLAGDDTLARLSEHELLEFLFLPGFSTATAVTDLSGRGVGLDVVQEAARSVGGVVRPFARPGEGLTIQLELPLTLSVVRMLLVEIADEPYAVPLTRIERLISVPAADLRIIEGRHYVTIDDGEHVGLVSAREVLEAGDAPAADPLRVAVVSDRHSRYGLVVDRFLGERDLVVQPLDPALGKIPNIGAAAMLEDGSPVLIADVDDLVRSIENLVKGGHVRRAQGPAEAAAARKRVLVVDDSVTVRELQRGLLESRGYDVTLAVDGMDGWNAVRTSEYDLVITDVDMPRLDGIGLVSRIRSDARLASLPVVIVSYKDREEDRLRGLEAGADHYLTKSSFEDDRFLTLLADLIGPSA